MIVIDPMSKRPLSTLSIRSRRTFVEWVKKNRHSHDSIEWRRRTLPYRRISGIFVVTLSGYNNLATVRWYRWCTKRIAHKLTLYSHFHIQYWISCILPFSTFYHYYFLLHPIRVAVNYNSDLLLRALIVLFVHGHKRTKNVENQRDATHRWNVWPSEWPTREPSPPPNAIDCDISCRDLLWTQWQWRPKINPCCQWWN